MPRYDDERYHDVTDENGLVRDGKIVRVSLLDSMRARGSLGAPYVVDSRPGGPWVIDHRRAPSTAQVQDARQALQDAYAEYDARDANAWKHLANGPQRDAGEFRAGNHIPVGAYPRGPGYAEGDACTVNGAPGTLQSEGDYLVCRPTSADARHVHKITQRDPMGREAASYEYEYDPDERHSNDGLSLADATQRLQDVRNRAYQDYDQQQADAWRQPK
jgi:hypothetical protein